MQNKPGSIGAYPNSGLRKTVVFVSYVPGGRDQSGSHPLSPQMMAAMKWGMSRGWDIIDLNHWRGTIPEGTQPDGLIARIRSDYKGFINTFYAQVPVGVFIDVPFSVDSPYALIQTDVAMAGYKAADYFLERRFKHFAICHYGDPGRSISLVEFEERVKAGGGTCASIVCKSDDSDTLSSQAQVMKRQLARLPMPVAIFCTNDRLARRTCRWCQDMGLAIPEQVAILGLGNDKLACEYGSVPISSIDLMPEQRGIEAARLLQRMMEGEPAPREPVRVPVGGVVTRRSTDILAVPDSAVAHALRYIWDHYRENIGIDQIAMACGISRSKLSRHFKSELGRTVIEELTRRRLQEACELLTTGDALITDIAAISGYRSPQYFNEQFRRAFGISPQQYRLRERMARRLT